MMDIDVIIVVDGDSLIQMQIWDVMASKVAPFDLAKYSYLNAYCPSSYGGGAQLSRRTCGTCKCIGWVCRESRKISLSEKK